MTKGTEVKYTQVEKEPFINLSDVPTSYSGQANKFLTVNSGETGVEFTNSWIMVMATADQSVTNSATLVPSTYLTINTVANTNYHVRLRVFWNTTNATADFKYRVTHSGTTTRVRRARTYAIASGTSATLPTLGISAAGTVAFDTSDQTLLATAIGDGIIFEDLIVQVGASGGTLRFEFAQNTQTSAQSVTVYEGSYIEYMVT